MSTIVSADRDSDARVGHVAEHDGGLQGGTPAAEGETPPSQRDLVLVGGRVPETGGYRVLRQRDDHVEVGELRTLEPGRALHGEVVRLRSTEQHDRVFECETIHASDVPAPRAGPPQIANAKYRKNWDQIFGALAEQIDEIEEPFEPRRLADSVPPDKSELN